MDGKLWWLVLAFAVLATSFGHAQTQMEIYAQLALWR